MGSATTEKTLHVFYTKSALSKARLMGMYSTGEGQVDFRKENGGAGGAFR